MPIYEYRCNNCGKTFEQLRLSLDRQLVRIREKLTERLR